MAVVELRSEIFGTFAPEYEIYDRQAIFRFDIFNERTRPILFIAALSLKAIQVIGDPVVALEEEVERDRAGIFNYNLYGLFMYRLYPGGELLYIRYRRGEA